MSSIADFASRVNAPLCEFLPINPNARSACNCAAARLCDIVRAQGDNTNGTVLAPGVRVREDAITVRFVRASGPGGQNVNNRATCAQLRVRIDDIDMNPRARERLERLARNAINAERELLIVRDTTRSQKRNKEACMDHLRDLARRAATPPKTRKKTRPTRGSVERRLDEKRKRGEKKRRRQEPGGDS